MKAEDKLGDKPGDKNRKEVLPKVITTKEKVYVAILNNPNITNVDLDCIKAKLIVIVSYSVFLR